MLTAGGNRLAEPYDDLDGYDASRAVAQAFVPDTMNAVKP
jgi:hypothetical protein